MVIVFKQHNGPVKLFYQTIAEGFKFVKSGEYNNALLCYQSARRKLSDISAGGFERVFHSDMEEELKKLDVAVSDLFGRLLREPRTKAVPPFEDPERSEKPDYCDWMEAEEIFAR